MTPDGLPPLGEVIKRYDLRANKSFGQNFLLDLNLTRRIAQAAKPQGKIIIEIGPGPGGLTRALLLEGVKQLICVEADTRFQPALEQIATHYPERLKVIYADALKVDLNSLTPHCYDVVANLPYNIGTPLLTRWLEAPWPPQWQQLTLMFQKEVAERLVAPSNSKAYGRLSILTQWRNDTDLLFSVPREAFVPPPKVTSAIVQIKPREPISAAEPEILFKVAAAAFNQRRKMLRKSLKQLCLSPEEPLAKAGIDATRRGESLTIDEFCALARAISGRQ